MKNFQKIIFATVLSLFFLMLVFLKVNSEGQSTVVSVAPASQSVQVGDTVTININISNVSNLYGCQITLSYNPSILQYQNCSEGTFLNQTGAAQTFTINPKVESGIIKGYAISRVGKVGGISGSGTLASFQFTTLTTGTSAITISTIPTGIEGTKLKNYALETVSYTKQDGQVTVSQATVQKPNIVLNKQVDKTTAQAGDTLTYTISYQNTGNSQAKNVVITDPVPINATYVAGSATGGGALSGSQVRWSIGTVAVGGTGTVSFKVRINN